MRKLILTMLLVSGICTTLFSATLTWDRNSESDLKGYRVHFSNDSTNLSSIIDVKNVTLWTINGLNKNIKYYFAVSAYDLAGNESGLSEIVNYIEKQINAPSGLKIVKDGAELKY